MSRSLAVIQIPEYLPSDALFTKDYAYLSSTSSSLRQHAEIYTKNAIKKLSLNQKSLVVEIASNDGYLLKYFKESDINCFGIEPIDLVANEASEKGY